MLVCHALWDAGAAGAVLVWAEDSRLPSAPSAPAPRSDHPFAAPADTVRGALGSFGSVLAATALGGAEATEAWVRLPVVAGAPQPSPRLLRVQTGPAAPGRARPRLGTVRVPALRLAAGPGLDLLVALSGREPPPSVRLGTSWAALAALGGLALEMVAAGRVLPDLVADEQGTWFARWAPSGGPADSARSATIARALPPSCRGLAPGPSGSATAVTPDPVVLVRHALAAFVDAACREALRRPALPAKGRGTVQAAWLAALRSAGAEVAGRPAELEALAADLAAWRASIQPPEGPWRLCLRLREPEPSEPVADDDARKATDADDGADPTWWIELLLQATDDPSLLVEASEVWRAGESLRRASRTVEDPQEVLLAELGRAVGLYPELAGALDEAAPTGLALDSSGAHRFLAEAAPGLEAAGVGVLLPAWWRRRSGRLGLRLRAVSTPRRSGSGSGLLDQAGLAEFDWQAALGDRDLGLDELRRLAALKAPLVRVRGEWVELDGGEVDELVRFLSGGRRATRATLGVADALRLMAGQQPAGVGVPAGVPVLGVEAQGLLGALLGGDAADAVSVAPTPAGFEGELRPYQLRGVAWLQFLERCGLGACLADDMGLGKTATVLAVVAAERTGDGPGPAGPTLVVCPTSVVGNWEREAARFTPALTVGVHHGATRARGDALARRLAGCDLVITSYPLVERDRTALGALEWGRLVLDEAQHVKNPAAKQTRAVRSLPASRRVALTGTPVENHLGELWSIMDILNPGLLGTETSFRRQFAVPIERYREEDAAERLRTLTRPFVLRRLKTDRSVIADLPEKIDMKVVCTLTREQATLYQAVVDQMLARIDDAEGIERRGLVLATMLRLKQVCNHPAQFLADGSALAGRSGKLERVVEVLEEAVDGGDRALVFTQFAEMGTLLRDHLADRLDCPVWFFHGGVPRTRRDAMVREFQEGAGDAGVMVLSLRAGGTGLNLTAANHVIHFDRWWNPAVEAQATDRAFRIGQRKDVQVRTLVCAGTVEDRIDAVMEQKRDLAERIVGTGEGWLTELSTDELAGVLRLSADAAVAP